MTEPTSLPEPADAAFLDLHARRQELERGLAFARLQQQFGTCGDDVARAGQDERELLLSLDRILTQIRAAEYKRQPGSRRW